MYLIVGKYSLQVDYANMWLAPSNLAANYYTLRSLKTFAIDRMLVRLAMDSLVGRTLLDAVHLMKSNCSYEALGIFEQQPVRIVLLVKNQLHCSHSVALDRTQFENKHFLFVYLDEQNIRFENR